MRVAFLGLGIMGSRMAANLASAGFELTVWNRTAATAERFAEEHGAKLAATPAVAAAGAELIVTMVVDGPQVEHVLLGPDGAAHGARRRASVRRLLDDRARRDPRDRRPARRARARPPRRARDRLLASRRGRHADDHGRRHQFDFERAKPLLEAMGKLIVHAGPLGHGQMVKLINNAVAAVNAATVGQALLVAARAGVDLDALTTVMAAGAGGSMMLDLKAGPMREHDYATLFKLDHMLKDVRLCLEEAQDAGVPFEFAALARQTLVAANGRGLGDADFAALIEVLEGQAGFQL